MVFEPTGTGDLPGDAQQHLHPRPGGEHLAHGVGREQQANEDQVVTQGGFK